MTDRQWQYLINLTNAYNTTFDGNGATRKMYSINLHGLMERSIGDLEYYSQEYQDFVIDNMIFHKKNNGVFIDIGANEPIYINNTYFLEKERNWTGLAFEPQKSRREKWNCRKTECLPFALSAENGEREFTEYIKEYDYMSGFSSVVSYDGEVKEKYTVQTRKLSDILEERGIKHVDYVSIDVEGAELEVLAGIDFDKCDFTCFTIELETREETFEVRKFMIEHGYVFLGRLWQDDIWIKQGYLNPDYEKEKRQIAYEQYRKG